MGNDFRSLPFWEARMKAWKRPWKQQFWVLSLGILFRVSGQGEKERTYTVWG